ncbi:MAG: tyrosine-type recombinase/integrase [Polyangiales bacterium]
MTGNEDTSLALRDALAGRRGASLSPALEPLVEDARTYARNARAERTVAAYRAQWRHFSDWCARHALAALPASPEAVVLYLTARAREGRKVATLAQALTAISQAHVRAGHGSPRMHPAVRETFLGIQRMHGSPPTQKEPLLIAELQRVVGTLGDDTSGLRDRALLLVGFAGAFRRSELCALSIDDVRFVADGLTIVLRRSKTDQEGRGRTIAVPRGAAALTCPVRTLEAWLQRAAIVAGPVFRSVDRHGNVGGALRGGDVACIIKRRVRGAGLDPATYSGHSLRAGLVTSAAKAGKRAHVIMKTTGHRSVAMVHRYIRDAELFTDNAAGGLL